MATNTLDYTRIKKDLRFDQTLNTVNPFNSTPFEALDGIADLVGYQFFKFDGLNYTGPASDGTSGSWLVTSVDGGAGAAESIALKASTQGGGLRITTNSTDNDNTQIQRVGSAFRYVPGQRLGFFASIAPQDADDGEIGLGLIIETDTDLVNTLPSDGLFFEKAETATTLDFHARKDGASTSSDAITSTLADDTSLIVGFVVNTDGSISVYNGTTLANMELIATVAANAANLPTDEDLTPAFQVQTGAAATRYLDIDWFFVWQEQSKI